MLEKWMQNNRLQDPDDMDALLETADLTRQLINEKDYTGIKTMINYVIENSLYEAFDWIMELLQEEYDKTDDCSLDDFVCDIGGSIADYNEFTTRLQVDFNVRNNDIEKVYDEHGEAEAFFNNSTYTTGYKNITLMSSENFDTRDFDYIRYKLLFSRSPAV